MKLRFLIVAAAFAALVTSTPAQACVLISDCNFSGADVDLGNLVVGQSGTITDTYKTLFSSGTSLIGFGLAHANLPTDAEVIFTYTFTGLLSNPLNSLSSGITYGPYTTGGNTYHGYSNANSIFGVHQQGYKNGVAGISQVLATASLSGTTSGTTTITNHTFAGGQSFQQFTTTLFGLFGSEPVGTATIQYRVIGLPLPASLPLMLLAIGGLFGFARMRKQRKAMAAA